MNTVFYGLILGIIVVSISTGVMFVWEGLDRLFPCVSLKQFCARCSVILATSVATFLISIFFNHLLLKQHIGVVDESSIVCAISVIGGLCVGMLGWFVCTCGFSYLYDKASQII